MPIDLTIKLQKNYIVAEFTGQRNPFDELKESIQLWSRIPKACEQYGVHKILIISKLDKRLNLDNTFSFVDKFKAIGWKANYVLAGVAFDEELLNEYKLLETFIKNFGYTCALFDNVKEAKKWLAGK